MVFIFWSPLLCFYKFLVLFVYNIISCISVSSCLLECDIVTSFVSLQSVLCTSYREDVCFRVVPVPGFKVDKDKTKCDYSLLKYDAI